MKIRTLLTSNFWVLLYAILIQQVVVASSSYWLVGFAQNLKDDYFSYTLLAAYLFSLVFPYFPAAYAHHIQTLWCFEILEKFYDKNLNSILGKVGLWNHDKFKSQKESLIIKDGPQYLNDLSLYIFDILSISFNAIFSILVVVWLLDVAFLWAYLLGLAWTFFILSYQSSTNEKLANQVEAQKNNMTQHLATAWDHWTLNNVFFLKLWKGKFSYTKEKYRDSMQALSKKKEFGSVLLSLTSFVPTLLATIYFAFKYNESPIDLLNLTILLPRLFMILSHTTSLIYLIRDYSIMKSRGKFIQEMEDQHFDEKWEERIKLDKIKFESSEGVASADQIDFGSAGYWTITGANGSGKSSWLMKLKQELGDKACYLPPRSALGIGIIPEDLSTGQKIKEQIQLALGSQTQVLLLDEWDANLDEKNRQEIMDILKRLGQSICVVDIRHRL